MPNPAYVIDGNWDFVAWNPAYSALVCDLAALESGQRNLLWIMFCWPPSREWLVEWEREAGKLLGQYRASPPLKQHSRRLDEIAEMLVGDADAQRWWNEHLIAGYSSAVLTFRHRQVGTLPLKYVKLDVVDDRNLHVVVFMSDSPPDRQRLESLTA